MKYDYTIKHTLIFITCSLALAGSDKKMTIAAPEDIKWCAQAMQTVVQQVPAEIQANILNILRTELPTKALGNLWFFVPYKETNTIRKKKKISCSRKPSIYPLLQQTNEALKEKLLNQQLTVDIPTQEYYDFAWHLKTEDEKAKKIIAVNKNRLAFIAEYAETPSVVSIWQDTNDEMLCKPITIVDRSLLICPHCGCPDLPEFKNENPPVNHDEQIYSLQKNFIFGPDDGYIFLNQQNQMCILDSAFSIKKYLNLYNLLSLADIPLSTILDAHMDYDELRKTVLIQALFINLKDKYTGKTARVCRAKKIKLNIYSFLYRIDTNKCTLIAKDWGLIGFIKNDLENQYTHLVKPMENQEPWKNDLLEGMLEKKFLACADTSKDRLCTLLLIIATYWWLKLTYQKVKTAHTLFALLTNPALIPNKWKALWLAGSGKQYKDNYFKDLYYKKNELLSLKLQTVMGKNKNLAATYATRLLSYVDDQKFFPNLHHQASFIQEHINEINYLRALKEHNSTSLQKTSDH
jgi:hypothetical protein